MTTVAVLIKDAYYLAQVLDPREEIEAFDATEGVRVINQIIKQWGSLSIYIPTYTILTLNLVAGTYSYNITPVVTQLSEAHLLDLNNVQYPLDIIDLARFNTLNFALSNQARVRPNLLFIQNDFINYPLQSKAVFYPVPDNTYTATLYAMQRLVEVEYEDDLSTVPDYWQVALYYEAAKRLSSINATILPASFADEYTEAMQNLKAANRRDKRVKVLNQFQTTRLYRPWGTYVD